MSDRMYRYEYGLHCTSCTRDKFGTADGTDNGVGFAEDGTLLADVNGNPLTIQYAYNVGEWCDGAGYCTLECEDCGEIVAEHEHCTHCDSRYCEDNACLRCGNCGSDPDYCSCCPDCGSDGCGWCDRCENRECECTHSDDDENQPDRYCACENCLAGDEYVAAVAQGVIA